MKTFEFAHSQKEFRTDRDRELLAGAEPLSSRPAEEGAPEGPVAAENSYMEGVRTKIRKIHARHPHLKHSVGS